ncbi:fimbrial protein [Pseudomonas sp. FP2335]|uniref:fimbrial protein n=1 Tax=Pseudomonas sp. FP2335 TaxID=2954092 RepID=UPI002733D95B|nr:fimbrial protein [Pseudomonas sp. FP2335]WLH77397.1 fimbrial protein [Pseudomonas sp. FP2335]
MTSLKQLACLAAISLAGAQAAFAANCTVTTNTNETLNFGASLANGSLTVPADTPDGTVIYQDTVQSVRNEWKCTGASQYGLVMNPALGSVTSGSTYPIGKTGLSFRIWIDALSRYEKRPFTLKPDNYGISPGSVRLEIVKSGPLSPQVKVAAGNLGNLQADDLIISKYNLTNPLVLNAASCQTPSVPVAMGDDYQLWEFRDAGATPRTIRFNIGLNQCQTGINKVTYSLKATTSVIDAAKGVVALNGGSTAKGIGLQLMDDAGQPIAFDTTYTFSGFTTTGANFKIPLSASYYRLPTGNVEAGSANTEVTFIVNYL